MLVETAEGEILGVGQLIDWGWRGGGCLEGQAFVKLGNTQVQEENNCPSYYNG